VDGDSRIYTMLDGTDSLTFQIEMDFGSILLYTHLYSNMMNIYEYVMYNRSVFDYATLLF